MGTELLERTRVSRQMLQAHRWARKLFSGTDSLSWGTWGCQYCAPEVGSVVGGEQRHRAVATKPVWSNSMNESGGQQQMAPASSQAGLRTLQINNGATAVAFVALLTSRMTLQHPMAWPSVCRICKIEMESFDIFTYIFLSFFPYSLIYSRLHTGTIQYRIERGNC